jgi:putative flippase GtrA
MIRQLLVYILMGGTATGIDWLAFYTLNVVGDVSYLWAVTSSFTLGACCNYLLNKFITFRDQTRQILLQLGVYGVICVFSLMGSIFLMLVLVGWGGLWPMTARIITTGVMLALNFLFHKFFTYNPQLYDRLSNLSRQGKADAVEEAP